MHDFTFWTGSFPESIEHNFMKALRNQTDNQMSTQLSQEGYPVGYPH